MIRAAGPPDDRRLAEIDLLTWSPLSSPAARPDPGGAFFVHGLVPDNVLVAEIQGAVGGYVALGRATRLASNAHVLAIHGLAVAPEHQGRGIGRRLLRAAIDEARARGARRLTLRVLGHNLPARGLYEAAGFRIEGVLCGEFLIGGRYVDDVLMALGL